MFNKRAGYEKFAETLQTKLAEQEKLSKETIKSKFKLAIKKIANAANLFDEAGLDVKAEIVTEALEKLADHSWVFKAPTGKEPDAGSKYTVVDSKSSNNVDFKNESAKGIPASSKSKKSKTDMSDANDKPEASDKPKSQLETTEVEKAETQDIKPDAPKDKKQNEQTVSSSK